MGGIIAYLAGPFGTFAVIAGAIIVAYGAWQLNNFTQRQKGAQQAIAKVERSNNAAASNARAAARGVTDRRVRGIEDPNAVDD
jgi:hypothetical protein